jgi:hypothetical protein
LHDTRNGKQRTVYSLRHYYATMALIYNRMSVYSLTKHLGTSVAMIEQHYGQVELGKLAEQLPVYKIIKSIVFKAESQDSVLFRRLRLSFKRTSQVRLVCLRKNTF